MRVRLQSVGGPKRKLPMHNLLKRLMCAWLMAIGLAQPADSAVSVKQAVKPPPPKTVEYSGPIRPALFRLTKGQSTVYLFGSIHLLPNKFTWRTPAIEQAISHADVFMFEANLDFATAEFHYFLDQHGYLPAGHTLHTMLSLDGQQQYASLIRDLHIDPDKLDHLRPGVAVMMLDQVGTGARLALGPGVDVALIRDAKQHAKDVGYLETLQSQLQTITAIDGGDGIEVLEKNLTERKDGDGKKYQDMLAAWAGGDLMTLSTMDGIDPKQRVLMLDNRNKNWIPRIESMLEIPKTYFITVGAAHLAGHNSVIELLCGKGWKVLRLQTGSENDTAPPPACGLVNSPMRRVAASR